MQMRRGGLSELNLALGHEHADLEVEEQVRASIERDSSWSDTVVRDLAAFANKQKTAGASHLHF
jgi:hypothetical protein